MTNPIRQALAEMDQTNRYDPVRMEIAMQETRSETAAMLYYMTQLARLRREDRGPDDPELQAWLDWYDAHYDDDGQPLAIPAAASR